MIAQAFVKVACEEQPSPGVWVGRSRDVRVHYAGDDPLRGLGRMHVLLGRMWGLVDAISALEATSTSLVVFWRRLPRREEKEAAVDAWRDVFYGGEDDVHHVGWGPDREADLGRRGGGA